MSQTSESQAFINLLSSLSLGPGVSLDQVLEPSIRDETQFRRLSANDRTHSHLSNLYYGLVDVFNAPQSVRTTRARVIDRNKPDDLFERFVMPLSDSQRRKDGEPAMVADIDEFEKIWTIFTEGLLSKLGDWNNVIAAGGSVLACLSPLPDEMSQMRIKERYQAAYPTSDIDLFLWGLTPEKVRTQIHRCFAWSNSFPRPRRRSSLYVKPCEPRYRGM